LVNTVATALLGIDDDDFYYRNVVRRRARPRGISSQLPGVVFLEIDGLAHEVLVHAIRNGEVPHIAAWLRHESHRLLRWETDWSSQTGACQAGLLHGSNDDMPAFRWWEKESGRAIVTNHPRDAMEIERRHSNGRGLLAFDGASRANILSGDAPNTLLTMSTVLRRNRPGRLGQDYFTYFANPYNLTRTLLLSIADVVTELWYASQQRRRNVQPRIERSLPYALVRAWATVVQRDLQVSAVIGDIFAGRPVVYTTFLGYDEVAHHSGIERLDTLHVLRRLDRQIERLTLAARDAPRPYRFVVLSDHGQSQGTTFKQRTGRSLEDLVKQVSRASSVEVQHQGSESLDYVAGSLTEAGSGGGAVAGAVRRATKSRAVDGDVRLGISRKARRRFRRGQTEGEERPEVVVMASGCLGLVYFARQPGRMTIEQIDKLYPDMILSLRNHPGIGFLMVRSAAQGALALGAGGVNYLEQGRVDGVDPLAPYGPNAARHLMRTDGFTHVADIMINGTYDENTTEVPAFEELVGSHGGMGGSQSFPFILYPAEWAAPEHPVIGAEDMHRCLRRWLSDLGHEGYRNAPDSPG
jgi:Type I phosphodiesterase / nucleotide pyrophosphatase